MRHHLLWCMLGWLVWATPAWAESGHTHAEGEHQQGHGHAEGEHQGAHGHAHEHEEEGVVELSSEQMRQAGIRSERLLPRSMARSLSAPGTVAFNAYRLAEVTAVFDGVVHARHVRLGDKVRKDQPLLVLRSPALAQAQAEYLRAEADFRAGRLALRRLEPLAKQQIVSQARLQQAQSRYQAAQANLAAARATLASYGMRDREIRRLVDAHAYGQLTLRAPSAGTITRDEFRLGQHVTAGTPLLQIVDESSVWVEVKLPQERLRQIRAGQSARVSIRGTERAYPARVVAIHHRLDATTRTVGVRLEAENPDDVLHPGMFVTAEIEIGTDGPPQLLLPAQAVQRQGQERIVFVEEANGRFERREVEVGEPVMGMLPVRAGLEAGENVVVEGAFVLLSELAKSGFAVHNH